MKVLVTGAAGFIGSHTCERLVAKGHEVIGYDVFSDFLYSAEIKRKVATHLQSSLDQSAFRLVEGDICDADLVSPLVAEADVVCHLAALAGVRPSLSDPRAYVRTNLDGTTVLLQACVQHDKKRFVFASSSSVYGVKGAGGSLDDVGAFREDDPCLRPASPYGASKRCGELLCSTYRDLYDIGISALRFFTVYGPRQRPDMAIHKFVKWVDEGTPITMFGDGSSRRDYTFVDDIVSGVVASIERIEPGAYNIYNLGGTHTHTLKDLIEAVERTVGKKATIERLADQPGDVPITFADIANARQDLGYEPTTKLDAGLDAFWRWYRQER